VSFDEDASTAPAIAAASAAYSAAVATAMEESSEDDDIYSLSALIVGGECSGDGADNTVKHTGKTDFSTSNSDRCQLYPNAEWLSCFVQQEHDPSVLTAYVILFYTFLFGTNITSHVEGLNNVTRVNKPFFVERFRFSVPRRLSTRMAESFFDPNFGWKSFATAVLDSLVREK